MNKYLVIMETGQEYVFDQEPFILAGRDVEYNEIEDNTGLLSEEDFKAFYGTYRIKGKAGEKLALHNFEDGKIIGYYTLRESDSIEWSGQGGQILTPGTVKTLTGIESDKPIKIIIE